MRLEIDNLAVRAGSFELGPISLAVGNSEYLVMLGPTGAGKTVTLETIAGLRTASGGQILMDGSDVTRAAPESRRIGFLYQDALLFPHLSVRDNLAYGAARIARGQRAEAIGRLARLLQIEPVLDRMPRGLSGGERQRVALGRALAGNPVLLLLDEPMAALDPNSRIHLRQTLLELHRELGTTTIHVTHDFAEALALGDRVAILIQGRLVQVGAPREVFARPDSALIAAFLRATPAGVSSEQDVPYAAVIRAGDIALRLVSNNGASHALLEAAHAEVEPEASGRTASEMLPGRVIAVEADGGAIRVSLNLGVEMRVTVGAGALAPGQSVLVRLPKRPG